jgi:quercetin dioxygenase-like cupin family protein
MRFPGAAVLALAAACAGAAPKTGGDAEVKVATEQAFPPLDGAALKLTVLEVSYAPGGSSQPHRHPCAVVGYVLEGSLRTQVEGGAEQILSPGQTFYEPPNGVHQVSANASTTTPVRFLAQFLCDHETPLTTPADTTQHAHSTN